MRIYDKYRLVDIHIYSKHNGLELFRKLGTAMVLNVFMNAYHVADTDFCIENAKAYVNEPETVIFTGDVRDLERTVTRIAKSDTWNPEDLKKLYFLSVDSRGRANYYEASSCCCWIRPVFKLRNC